MSGLVKKPYANAKTWTPPSEVTVWLGVIAMVGILNIIFSIWDLYAGRDPAGRDPVAAFSDRAAVSLGVLLGWGGVRVISRDHEDTSLLGLMVVLLGDGRWHQPLLVEFALSFAAALVVCSFVAVLRNPLRSARARRFPNVELPSSGHLLDDAEVDDAEESGVDSETNAH